MNLLEKKEELITLIRNFKKAKHNYFPELEFFTSENYLKDYSTMKIKKTKSRRKCGGS